MGDRSLVSLLAAGLAPRTKASGMGMLTDVRPLTGGRIMESFPGAWQRNITVEGAANLTSYSPVYACVTRIAGDIAKLGLLLMSEDEKTQVLSPAVKSSPYWPVIRKPNGFQNRIQFVRQWLLSKLLFGNAYALKQRDARGIVTALYVLDPRKVKPLVTQDGAVYYGISSDDLARIPGGLAAAPASEVIHDRGPTLWHPLVGVPPIYACALSGSLGLRIQQNSLKFFANMSRPSGLLTAAGTIDDITADRFKREWEQNYGGDNVGRVAMMGDGITYQAMTIAAEASQLVEQLGVSAVDVATAFGMPAYKINQGPIPTNNNVQALNQQYYSDCLQVYVEDLELCLSEGLNVPDGYSVQCDLDGLLRMDSATQMEVLAKGVGGAILKPNEARQRLNRGPVKGGDQAYLQQQNFSLEALAKRDALPNPFVIDKPTSTTDPSSAGAAPVADPDGAAAAADATAKALEAGGAALLGRMEETMAKSFAAQQAAQQAALAEHVKAAKDATDALRHAEILPAPVVDEAAAQAAAAKQAGDLMQALADQFEALEPLTV